jgi:flagellar motility protein MotE (MotC chaperone)
MPALHRLLKLLIAAAGLMLAVRMGTVWHDAGVAFAQNGPAPQTQPMEQAKVAPPPTPSAAPDPLKPATATQKFSPTEVELLQNLAKRRAELEQRSEQLDQRELLLTATEQRVQEKIDRLQQMQAQIDAALGKVDEQEEQRLQSLVRIYEAMKPQEAALIFDKLEQPVLMQVLTRMKDRAVAAILPHLDGDKARAVTIVLAQHKQMPDLKTN